ncbi:MAG: hypothetical protein ACRDNT_04790 [Streptosporangiaceae bacterium]
MIEPEHPQEVADPAGGAHEGVELGLQGGVPRAEFMTPFPADRMRRP